MKMKEILDFVDFEYERLMNFYKFNDATVPKYTILIKIMEELGELSQEVLKSQNLQREHKLKEDSRIGEEMADVILATMILAKNEGIDIKQALKEKIDKIKKRDY